VNEGNPHQHLNLRGWPFQVVPSEETAAIWVGRPEVEKRLRRLLRTISRVAASRIVLLWAAYGAGKTHALMHLQHKARESDDVRVLYVVTPKTIKNFLDIYRAIIEAALKTDLLSDLGMELFRKGGANQPTDLRRALARIVSLPEPQHRAALSWLKVEKVGARELRESSLTRRLETSTDGVEALDELVGLVRNLLGSKLVLLLDEIQELGELKPAQLDEAVGGLHKVFDRNTDALTMVFCFTTAAQHTVAKVIGQTLYERRSETLTLPPLERQDAIDFVIGLIKAWSIEPDRAPFPFENDAITAVVDRLPTEEGLTPRDLIRAFDAVLRAADPEIEDSDIDTIGTEYALTRLREEGEFLEAESA
jgi:AAA ATPase domain